MFVRGRTGFGALVGGGIVPLSGRLGRGGRSLRGVIAADRLGEAAELAAGRGAEFAVSDVTLLPPIPDPEKILCVGVNYERHRQETNRAPSGYPTIFTRFADTLVGHGAAIVKPAVSDSLDFEGELALVIGRGGRNIPEECAFEHVAGYAPFMDGSVRDFQRHTGQFTPGKNFPATGGFGPALVTPETVGDVTALPIVTRVNGSVMQEATLADLVFSIPRVIAYVSTFTALAPGDVIATGTPGGVGERRDPPVFLADGDVVDVDVGAAGRLRNVIRAED